MSIPTTPQQALDIARLQTHTGDPNNAAYQIYLDYLENNVLNHSDIPINTLSDLQIALSTLSSGLAVIDDHYLTEDGCEEPLTEEVGPYYAEALDTMATEARASSPEPDGVHTYLRAKINALIDVLPSD